MNGGPKPSYAHGDRVLHPKFGAGTVLFTTRQGGLRINFDAGQLRFVMASYVEPIEGTQAPFTSKLPPRGDGSALPLARHVKAMLVALHATDLDALHSGELALPKLPPPREEPGP